MVAINDAQVTRLTLEAAEMCEESAEALRRVGNRLIDLGAMLAVLSSRQASD